MVESENYRNNRITVFNADGSLATQYQGKIYIYYDHKKSDGCIHFVTEDGKHHRIYGNNCVTIDEY